MDTGKCALKGASSSSDSEGNDPRGRITTLPQRFAYACHARVRDTDLGNAVGVTVVGDTVFAESDSGFVYALDAVTGRMKWRARVDTQPWETRFVVDGRVFVG